MSTGKNRISGYANEESKIHSDFQKKSYRNNFISRFPENFFKENDQNLPYTSVELKILNKMSVLDFNKMWFLFFFL